MRAGKGRKGRFIDEEQGEGRMQDEGCAGWGEAGVGFREGAAVCGRGEERGGGFERDAREGWESDGEGGEDVGNGEGEGVGFVQGVGGEGGEG